MRALVLLPCLAALAALAACSPDPDRPVLPKPDPFDPKAAAEIFAWSDREVACIAKAAYFEARGEGEEGMIAVAHVVMNRTRVSSYPDTPCAVVGQSRRGRCQFSFMCDGKPEIMANKAAYARALAIAEGVATERIADPTGGAVMFHAERIDPYWTDSFEKTTTMGGHVFYRFD